MKEKISVIITAAGKGERSGLKENKIFAQINGVPCIKKTYDLFAGIKEITDIFITANENDYAKMQDLFPAAEIIKGGASRTGSVKNALAAIDDGIVLIHDGARPFVTEKIVKDCIGGVKKHGSAVTAIPTRDTVAKNSGGNIVYLGKAGLLSVQTPQGFFVKDIKKAYELSGDKAFNDDGEVYLNAFGKLNFSDGDKNNIKLTFPEDFRPTDGDIRFGTGFDCHRLVTGRKLILGGITIPHEKGLLGHSDADVLLHAISDAILSAACMRDIGFWFPDNDDKYKDADSADLLKTVLDVLKNHNAEIISVNLTIIAQEPKLSPYIEKMRQNLASLLNISASKISLSATTTENLGIVGEKQAIAAITSAVVC